VFFGFGRKPCRIKEGPRRSPFLDSIQTSISLYLLKCSDSMQEPGLSTVQHLFFFFLSSLGKDQSDIKGILSRDFDICFLVSIDISVIAAFR
jgi:hypothetical protein